MIGSRQGVWTVEWDYFRTLGVVGFVALVIQVLVFVWENRPNREWKGIEVPVTLKQVLVEWATYMLIFIIVSMVLRGALHFMCSFC